MRMGRELYAPSRRVFYTGRRLGTPLTRSSCPWSPPVVPVRGSCPLLPSAVPARISADKGRLVFRPPPFGLGPGAHSRQSSPKADTLAAPGGTHLIDRIIFPPAHPSPSPWQTNQPVRS